MSEGPALAAHIRYKSERLAEIARMADLLTDRLLNDQIMGHAVSKEGIAALLKASSLLKDYGQAIPPLLSQIVQDFGDDEASEPPEGHVESELEEAVRLEWLERPPQERTDRES